MTEGPSRRELANACCWEVSDLVPGRPATTAFRRRLRLHQARWREAHRHPIGTQPIIPRDGRPSRLLGSHLPFDYARTTGATFLTAGALAAAAARTVAKERHQRFDVQRLWADLLSSAALCFNLFGDLAADPGLADRAVHSWWPDTPGTVRDIRFAHSPGRLDAAYLGNLSTFDVAFVLDIGDGARGVLGVEVAYNERIKRALPKPDRLPRYLEITERSGVFASGAADAVDAVDGTELLPLWLDHLLVLSMLQHRDGNWRWGRLVVVHPAGNTDLVEACARYRDLLVDGSTFASVTVEDILDAGALPAASAAALHRRYVPG